MHTPVDQELHADCSSRGVLHRSNLLIHRHGGLKIGDSTLANAYYYGLGCCRPLTSCWGSADYGFGIDVWSARCLLAEMFLSKPLPRATTEVSSSHRRRLPPPILAHGGDRGSRWLCGAGSRELGAQRIRRFVRSVERCRRRCRTTGPAVVGGGGAASSAVVSPFSKKIPSFGSRLLTAIRVFTHDPLTRIAIINRDY
jgi:hypothetical protein